MPTQITNYGDMDFNYGELKHFRVSVYASLAAAQAESNNSTARIVYVMDENKFYFGLNGSWTTPALAQITIGSPVGSIGSLPNGLPDGSMRIVTADSSIGNRPAIYIINNGAWQPLSYWDTRFMLTDGSRAFTAYPTTTVNTAPTQSAQLTPKSYVDSSVSTASTNASTALTTHNSDGNAHAGKNWQSDTQVTTTVNSAITAHVALTNPHPQYQTQINNLSAQIGISGISTAISNGITAINTAATTAENTLSNDITTAEATINGYVQSANNSIQTTVNNSITTIENAVISTTTANTAAAITAHNYDTNAHATQGWVTNDMLAASLQQLQFQITNQNTTISNVATVNAINDTVSKYIVNATYQTGIVIPSYFGTPVLIDASTGIHLVATGSQCTGIVLRGSSLTPTSIALPVTSSSGMITILATAFATNPITVNSYLTDGTSIHKVNTVTRATSTTYTLNVTTLSAAMTLLDNTHLNIVNPDGVVVTEGMIILPNAINRIEPNSILSYVAVSNNLLTVGADVSNVQKGDVVTISSSTSNNGTYTADSAQTILAYLFNVTVNTIASPSTTITVVSNGSIAAGYFLKLAGVIYAITAVSNSGNTYTLTLSSAAPAMASTTGAILDLTSTVNLVKTESTLSTVAVQPVTSSNALTVDTTSAIDAGMKIILTGTARKINDGKYTIKSVDTSNNILYVDGSLVIDQLGCSGTIKTFVTALPGSDGDSGNVTIASPAIANDFNASLSSPTKYYLDSTATNKYSTSSVNGPEIGLQVTPSTFLVNIEA
jgi:hypothetical protein